MCFALSGAISFSLAESPPRDLQITTYRWWSAQVHSSTNWVWLQTIFCLCVHEATLFSFFRSLLRENGGSLRSTNIFIKKTRWSNDETIIELGYRKIFWFVSLSARHWQITIFCSTSFNNIVNYSRSLHCGLVKFDFWAWPKSSPFGLFCLRLTVM